MSSHVFSWCDESDRMLASCTVQRFAGCSVPSNYSLWLSPALQCAISSLDACIASVCSGLQLSLNDVVYAADLWNLVLDSTAKSDDLPMGPGTPPFFLAQLVWGSVFIEYLSHFSLIPLRLTNAISSAYERHLRKPQNASFPNQYLQEQPPRSHRQYTWLIHSQVTKSERLWSSFLSVFPLNCINAIQSFFLLWIQELQCIVFGMPLAQSIS